jgi:hypothetical protein
MLSRLVIPYPIPFVAAPIKLKVEYIPSFLSDDVVGIVDVVGIIRIVEGFGRVCVTS